MKLASHNAQVLVHLQLQLHRFQVVRVYEVHDRCSFMSKNSEISADNP